MTSQKPGVEARKAKELRLTKNCTEDEIRQMSQMILFLELNGFWISHQASFHRKVIHTVCDFFLSMASRLTFGVRFSYMCPPSYWFPSSKTGVPSDSQKHGIKKGRSRSQRKKTRHFPKSWIPKSQNPTQMVPFRRPKKLPRQLKRPPAPRCASSSSASASPSCRSREMHGRQRRPVFWLDGVPF